MLCQTFGSYLEIINYIGKFYTVIENFFVGFLSITMIKTSSKARWGEKGLFYFHFRITIHRERSQGMTQFSIMQVGPEKETIGECCLLVCPHGLFSLLS